MSLPWPCSYWAGFGGGFSKRTVFPSNSHPLDCRDNKEVCCKMTLWVWRPLVLKLSNDICKKKEADFEDPFSGSTFINLCPHIQKWNTGIQWLRSINTVTCLSPAQFLLCSFNLWAGSHNRVSGLLLLGPWMLTCRNRVMERETSSLI